MLKSNWNYPTTIWVGENRIRDLGLACNDLNIKKPLLVTDSGLVNTKMISETILLLKGKNISVQVFSNIIGNPTGTNVNDGVSCFKKNDCDGVIAFGGGSGLDVGKAVAFMSGQNLPIWELYEIVDVLKRHDLIDEN